MFGLSVVACAAFPKRYTHSSALAVVVALYALAKALESLDKPTFAGHIVSGHTSSTWPQPLPVIGSCGCSRGGDQLWHRLQTLSGWRVRIKLNESDRLCSFSGSEPRVPGGLLPGSAFVLRFVLACRLRSNWRSSRLRLEPSWRCDKMCRISGFSGAYRTVL
jgi:hypothetical protein